MASHYVGWGGLGPFRLTAVSLRNIATIAVFYALPVVQLVITYQTVSRSWLPGPEQAWG